jgi:nucleotide-binding universal stress UspA family protein
VYKSIVVGTDGSTTARGAFDVALGLARSFDARLHVVCVHDPGPSAAALTSAPGAGVAIADFEQALSTHVSEVLAQAQASAAAEGVDVTTHAPVGPPGPVLVQVAAAEGADIVVVGNRGMRGARRILGSVPNHVTHHAPCAVLIVPTT